MCLLILTLGMVGGGGTGCRHLGPVVGIPVLLPGFPVARSDSWLELVGSGACGLQSLEC